MATIQEIIRARRLMLGSGLDDEMLQAMARLYASITPSLIEQAERLAAEVTDPDAPLARQVARQQAQTLAASVGDEVARIAPQAVTTVERGRLAAIQQALGDQRLIVEGFEVASRINVPAVERIVASVLPGSPVADLFATLPAVTSAQARDVLVRGVTLGKNPRQTGRELAQVMQGSRARAQTIARTETLRSYRGAAQEFQRANADVLAGWVWLSARDQRTCAMCWAMHGSVHPLEEDFGSHPNCRCSAGPMPTNEPPLIVSGPVAFGNLDPDAQRKILGPGAYEAYQRGEIDISDLVSERRDPVWGTVRHRRSLGAARGGHPRRLTAEEVAPDDSATAREARDRAARDYDLAAVRMEGALEANDRDAFRAAQDELGDARRRYMANAGRVVPDEYLPQRSLEAAVAEGKRLGVSAEYVRTGKEARNMPILSTMRGYGSGAPQRDMARLVNEVNTEVNRLQRAYPAAREARIDTLVFQRGSGRAHVVYDPKDPQHRSAMRLFAQRDRDHVEYVNGVRTVVSGEEMMLRYIARRGAMHGTTVTPQDVIRHEFAHTMTFREGPAAGARIEKSWTALWKGHANRKRVIGEYGNSSPAEGIAEALAIYTHPDYGTPSAPRYFSTGLPNGRLPGYVERWCDDFLNGVIR